jgi:hypothetical protein
VYDVKETEIAGCLLPSLLMHCTISSQQEEVWIKEDPDPCRSQGGEYRKKKRENDMPSRWRFVKCPLKNAGFLQVVHGRHS